MAVVGIFHPGSGLGNQLHRYVATRVLARDKNLDFGMVAPPNFKGASFMNLDMGVPVNVPSVLGAGGQIFVEAKTFAEKKIVENGIDIRGYDPDINFVEDDTIIDGEFQSEAYFGRRMHEVNQWLQVEPLGMPNNVCVIGFRGGEFRLVPELFLPIEYWITAMDMMRKINPDMRFWVVTDDPQLARMFLPPEVKVFHDIGTDWRMVRHAKYLIIANSSFYILPSLLNTHANKIISPKYWARRNLGGPWATHQNWYPKFTYI